MELIVVIAIMSVLTGFLVLSMGIIPKNRVRACSKELVSKLEQTRTDALSFYNAKLELYRDADGIYTTTIISKDTSGTGTPVTEKIGKGDLELYFLTTESGASRCILQDGDKLVFSFKRSSGGFLYLEGSVGGNPVTANVYCKEIKVACGSYERIIELVPLTGKVHLE